MCDQTVPYSPGTWVWAKLVNRIWWPGQIVELTSIPDELDYYKKKTKNAKTAVYFERDKSYEIINNLDKVFLYSCPQKMEFVEKGYLLYIRQKNKGTTVGGFEMINFIDDVKNVEKDIGGDIHIFDKFIEKNKSEEDKKMSKINIKDLFITEKERKKRERDERRSLSSTSVNKSKPNNKNTTSLQNPRKTISKMPIAPQCFVCPFCDDFSTNRYNNLKWHMDAHKNESVYTPDEESPASKKSVVTKKSTKSKKAASSSSTSSPQMLSSTPKKRKNNKTKNTDSKKIKLQDELLKDWDDEDPDESNIQVKDSNDLDLTKDKNTDTIQHNDKGQVKDSNQDEVTDQNNVTKIDSLPLQDSSKIKESALSRIFDFDDCEEDNNELNDSFQSHSTLGMSNDISKLPKKSWSCVNEIIFGSSVKRDKISERTDSDNELNNSSDSVGKEFPTSTQNDNNQISNLKEDEDIQIDENVSIDMNKETSNDENNSADTDNEQLENIETEDKADSELGNNIENFLSTLPEPDWVKINWEKLNSKDGHDKEYTRVDYTKKLQVNPYPLIIEKKDDNITLESFTTEISSRVKDVDSKPLKVFFPKIPPVNTDDELQSLENFSEILELAEAGGKIMFKLNCPKIYYESSEQ